jgi:SAM-dependent methyltransferase
MSDDKPIALAAYEALAERYAALAESKAENGYNEHPAMRKQIGDPRGLSVLDAGCGPGFLSRWLIDQGAAETVGFDVSPAMIRLARERCQGAAEFFVGDLAQPLSDLAPGRFDLVVSSLAIDYVRDWSVTLSEFQRVLKPRGRLVMSVLHPLSSYAYYRPKSAFGVHYVEGVWKGFGGEPVTVPDYYRSVEEIIMPVRRAGFQLMALVETKPLPELEQINPRKYHQGMTMPAFLIVDAKAE